MASSSSFSAQIPSKIWVKYVTGRATGVPTGGCDTVDDFIKAIKKELELPFPPQNITLHCTEFSEPLRPGLPLTQLHLQPSYIENSDDHPIFVHASSASAPTSRSSSESSLNLPKVPHPHRLKRWEQLNQVLRQSKRKKARVGTDGGYSCAYSYSKWIDLERIFKQNMETYKQSVVPIPVKDFQILFTILSWIFQCYQSKLLSGPDNEAKRVHLIAPVLWSVVHLLPDVVVNIETNLDGNRVNAHGHFEFVLTRGSKRVCIVEAKQEMFSKGMAQNLLGCEVAADLDDSHEVYGIVTNFEKWIFLKSLDEKILCDEYNSIEVDSDGKPKQAGLLQVVGKLHSLLL